MSCAAAAALGSQEGFDIGNNASLVQRLFQFVFFHPICSLPVTATRLFLSRRGGCFSSAVCFRCAISNVGERSFCDGSGSTVIPGKWLTNHRQQPHLSDLKISRSLCQVQQPLQMAVHLGDRRAGSSGSIVPIAVGRAAPYVKVACAPHTGLQIPQPGDFHLAVASRDE